MEKRSLKIAGHATSVSLEPEFWQALEDIARHKNTSLPALIADIDKTKSAGNLSSAIRIFILNEK
jgi:predicted DNA-binding ribbon-helix-helix protein